jgi:hypothetical protein
LDTRQVTCGWEKNIRSIPISVQVRYRCHPWVKNRSHTHTRQVSNIRTRITIPRVLATSVFSIRVPWAEFHSGTVGFMALGSFIIKLTWKWTRANLLEHAWTLVKTRAVFMWKPGMSNVLQFFFPPSSFVLPRNMVPHLTCEFDADASGISKCCFEFFLSCLARQ